MKILIIFLLFFLIFAGFRIANKRRPSPTSIATEKIFEAKNIIFDGKNRKYLIYVPLGIKMAVPTPLVFIFHGNKETPEHMAEWTGFNEEADKRGWLVVYPQGYENNWNAGKGLGADASHENDADFIISLLAELERKYPVDPHRIYMAGISNGAQMVDLLACKYPEKFAAAGMVAHTHNNVCDSAVPVPIIIMHGTADKFAPFNGGGDYKVSSHQETVNYYMERNGVPSIPKEDYKKGKAWVRFYGPGKLSTEVVDIIFQDGGHTWPDGYLGNPILMNALLGETNRDINATKFLADFFSRFYRKQ